MREVLPFNIVTILYVLYVLGLLLAVLWPDTPRPPPGPKRSRADGHWRVRRVVRPDRALTVRRRPGIRPRALGPMLMLSSRPCALVP